MPTARVLMPASFLTFVREGDLEAGRHRNFRVRHVAPLETQMKSRPMRFSSLA